jgi:hypothetical protein
MEVSVKLYKYKNNVYLDSIFQIDSIISSKFTSLIGHVDLINNIKYLRLVTFNDKIIELKDDKILYIGCILIDKNDILNVINENYKITAKVVRKHNIIEIIKSNDDNILYPLLYGGRNDNNGKPRIEIKHVQTYNINLNKSCFNIKKFFFGVIILGCLYYGCDHKYKIK